MKQYISNILQSFLSYTMRFILFIHELFLKIPGCLKLLFNWQYQPCISLLVLFNVICFIIALTSLLVLKKKKKVQIDYFTGQSVYVCMRYKMCIYRYMSHLVLT